MRDRRSRDRRDARGLRGRAGASQLAFVDDGTGIATEDHTVRWGSARSSASPAYKLSLREAREVVEVVRTSSGERVAVLWGADTCIEGEQCCLATVRCFDVEDAATCSVPPMETDSDACALNSDFGPDEICEAGSQDGVRSVQVHCDACRRPCDVGG